MSSATALYQGMLDITDRGQAHSTLGVIPFISEHPKDRGLARGWYQQIQLMTRYLTGFNGKQGLGVYVTMGATRRKPDTMGSIKTHAVWRLTVIEHRNANAMPTGFAPGGNGLHADDVAVALAQYFTNWTIGGLVNAVRPGEILTEHAGWIPPELRKEDGPDFFCAAFELEGLAVFDLPQKCYPVTFSWTGGALALACATAGATITYTTNGAYPAVFTDNLAVPPVANVNGAVAYTAPFAVTSGQFIRAVATKSGFADSDLTQLEIV